jgi:outer membrane protein assembly factor BamB
VPDDDGANGCASWTAEHESDHEAFPVDAEGGPADKVFLLENAESDVDEPGIGDPEQGDVVQVRAIEDGQELWTLEIDRSAGPDFPIDLELGPDGETVFVTATSLTSFNKVLEWANTDFLTAAIDATTGEVQWQDNATGPAGSVVESMDGVVDMSVTETGVVLVTRTVEAPPDTDDWMTVARDVETGEILWRHERTGAEPATVGTDRETEREMPFATAVSPDGATVYVAGQLDWTEASVVAYDALTGEIAWETKADPFIGNGCEYKSEALDVVAGSQGVYVRVRDQKYSCTQQGMNNLLVGLDAATGGTQWAKEVPVVSPATYFPETTRLPNHQQLVRQPAVDDPMVMHEEESMLYVTHAEDEWLDEPGSPDPQITAYDPSTGEKRWGAFFHTTSANGIPTPDGHVDRAGVIEIGVSSDGSRLLATGYPPADASLMTTDPSIMTKAYDAADGEQAWASAHTEHQTPVDDVYSTRYVSTVVEDRMTTGGLAVTDSVVATHGWFHPDHEPSSFVTVGYEQEGPEYRFPSPLGGGLS